MKKYDIFISYRRDDGAQYARIIQLLLENSGYSVFLDYEELRDGKFGKKIESAIKESSIFILILTRKYLSRCWRTSDWVRQEIMMAIDEEKKIIPIVPNNIPVHVPALIDRKIKNLLRTEQFSFIDFGLQLRENVRTLITERIENEVNLNLETFNDIPYSKILPFVIDESHYPINYVKHEEGIVLHPFTSLIIGFDDIGQEIFKFIYEFSSFIGLDNKRCKFKCYAVDENIDKLAGKIHVKMPAIGVDELSLIHTSANSEKLWNVITDNINDLNYIVISLDDIQTSIFLLSQIYNICRVYNRNNVGLFIKCKNYRTLHDILKLNELMGTHNIHPFVIGHNIEYESVLLDKAKEFHHLLNRSLLSPDEEWNLHFGESNLKTNIQEKRKISYYDAIIEINRRKAQIISSMLNSYTMKILLGLHKDDDFDKFNDYIDDSNSRVPMHRYRYDHVRLISNMAHMEHERWVSSQRLLGYTFDARNDMLKKQSSHMCPWKDMDDTIRSYDFNVVEASIMMMFKRRKNIKKLFEFS